MIIMPSPLGATEPRLLPDWVVPATGPQGEPYFKVPDEYAAAVAGALNSFQVYARDSATSDELTLGADRVSGVGDLGRAVADERRGRGIMLTGDVFSAPWVLVDFVDRILGNEGMYVLAAPDGGWVSDDDPYDPSRGRPDLGPAVKRAVAGWRWGALIGGVVGLAVIGAHAMRTR